MSVCTVDKSKEEISQNFVAFSEYTNFKKGPIFRKHNQYSNLEGTLQYGNMGCLDFKGAIQN